MKESLAKKEKFQGKKSKRKRKKKEHLGRRKNVNQCYSITDLKNL